MTSEGVLFPYMNEDAKKSAVPICLVNIVITNPLYVPLQGADFLGSLSTGCEHETGGVSLRRFSSPLAGGIAIKHLRIYVT